MKRDMDVIRKLTLYLEQAEQGKESDDFDVDFDQYVIDYHLRLMSEAGLIEITTTRGAIIFRRMTWNGHDFADNCRDDTIWRKTREAIRATAKTVSFDLLTQTLKATLAKALLG